MKNPEIGVLVVGCGTVGSGTVAALLSQQEHIRSRSGVSLRLTGIVSRTFATAREHGFPEDLFRTDLSTALQDEHTHIVVETVGGMDTAEAIIRSAIAAGKHVVTANKALIAERGSSLFTAARDAGVTIAFEASCAGGIPIVRSIYDGLAANRIDALFGIVNGTSNYILSRMVQDGSSYEDALAEAQREGYAEADPTLDVNGTDSTHKIAILSRLAFGLAVHPDDIPTVGIDSLDSADIAHAARLGYVVKLLAVAMRHGTGVSLFVRPAFISREHPLAWVSGPFNAVSVYGNVSGHTMYYGRGAGGAPTGASIIADIVTIARGCYAPVFEHSCAWDSSDALQHVPAAGLEHRFYLRMLVDDTPGTLARITKILSDHGISIASVMQAESDEQQPPKPVQVVITLHRTVEETLSEPLAQIAALEAVKQAPRPITIVDEHPE